MVLANDPATCFIVLFCRCESIELRAGDRIRWTRNDQALGVINSGMAEVLDVHHGRVTLRLEEGGRLMLTPRDPQLGHLDRAWCSTVHAFRGRTVDNVIAAMEANRPKLTTQKSFYVEISRARDKAELVTDDAAALREQLESVTGERISALEGIGEAVQPEKEKDAKALHGVEPPGREASVPASPVPDMEPVPVPEKALEPEPPVPDRHIEMDLEL